MQQNNSRQAKTSPNQSGKPSDQEVYDFYETVRNRDWSIYADTYCDVVRLHREERQLFDMAMRVGTGGLYEFITEQRWMLWNKIEAEFKERLDRDLATYRDRVEEMQKLLEEHAPLYCFERKCESHDWYYHYSDDNRVWRAGNDREAALLDYAKSKGREYMSVFEKCAAKNGRGGVNWGLPVEEVKPTEPTPIHPNVKEITELLMKEGLLDNKVANLGYCKAVQTFNGSFKLYSKEDEDLGTFLTFSELACVIGNKWW